jgi:predicted RNase H-like HicB family nuclease
MMMLRCYAEGHAGSWQAYCLDFDLAVQGESFEGVYRSLQDAIALYVETVKELPEAERRRFFERKAPLSLRLKFLWLGIRSLFDDDGDQMGHAEMVIPCAA